MFNIKDYNIKKFEYIVNLETLTVDEKISAMFTLYPFLTFLKLIKLYIAYSVLYILADTLIESFNRGY